MKPLTVREIIDGLKRLGVNSPPELMDCYREYVVYCILRNLPFKRDKAK